MPARCSLKQVPKVTDLLGSDIAIGSKLQRRLVIAHQFGDALGFFTARVPSPYHGQ